MYETINSPLFGFVAMLMGFLIVLPVAMNLTHRVFGGGYVSAGSWISMALFLGSFGGILTMGKLYGHPYLATIPAVIVAYGVMKVCNRLGMYDGWSPKKPFALHTVRLRVAQYGSLAVILALVAGLEWATPYLALALGTGSATFGFAAILIGAHGYREWNEMARRESLSQF